MSFKHFPQSYQIINSIFVLLYLDHQSKVKLLMQQKNSIKSTIFIYTFALLISIPIVRFFKHNSQCLLVFERKILGIMLFQSFPSWTTLKNIHQTSALGLAKQCMYCTAQALTIVLVLQWVHLGKSSENIQTPHKFGTV